MGSELRVSVVWKDSSVSSQRLRLAQVVPRQCRKIEVQGRQLGDEQLGARKRAEGGHHFHIPPAAVTGGGAVPALFAIDVKIAEQAMIVASAEGAEQAGELPLGRAPATTEEACL